MRNYKIAVNGRFLTQRLTGVQRYAYEITKGLLAEGVDLVVFVPDQPLLNSYPTTGWPIVRVKCFGGQLWEQTSLPLYLRAKHKTYILLNLCNTAPVLYDKNIVTLHDLSFIENPEWFKKRFVWSYKLIIPRLLKNALTIITVSNFSKREIEKYYPFTKDKVNVIYNAAVVAKSINDCDSLLFLKKNKLVKHTYLLFVGSIEPRKNLRTLIQSFFDLNNETFHLVLVGTKGKVFDKVDLEIKEDSRIKVLGHVSDYELQILYQNAFCFIYPSLYEGFGIPPLEAMQNGCPVIVSKIPSLQEVCTDAALFVSPLDAKDISNKIELVISDAGIRKKLQEAGLNRSSFFSWEKSGKEMASLLRRSTVV